MDDERQAAMEYLRTDRTHFVFKRVRLNIGAFWTVFGNVHLNVYNDNAPLDNMFFGWFFGVDRLLCLFLDNFSL